MLSFRLNGHENALLEKYADESDLSVSAYLHARALNKKISSLVTKEQQEKLVRLGRKQKTLFDAGLRTDNQEYRDVMCEIARFCDETKALIIKKSRYIAEIREIERELEILENAKRINLYGRKKHH